MTNELEIKRLAAVLVEQRALLTDDLRKADPARWARAQIALADTYVAIDPPRLKAPEVDEDDEFRTRAIRPDLPLAAYGAALSEARHLSANEIVHALVRRGSLSSGTPHAIFHCQHAVIGSIPEAGQDRSEILPFLGKRLLEAPPGIDDRHYCEARAGLAEALIAFAIKGVNRAWRNQPAEFRDGLRPYLDEAVEAARAAVSRHDPATIDRCRRVLMMALAALGGATADATLYDEAVAVGSLAAGEQGAARTAPEWQLLHYWLARTLEAREALRPDAGASLAQIADCYRTAMEQPLFGYRLHLRNSHFERETRAPIAARLDRVVRRQAERESLTIDQFLIRSAPRLPEASPAARAGWAAEAAMFAARTDGPTALAIVDAMHALARRHEEVALWEFWGDALASACRKLDASQVEARKSELWSYVERFNTPAIWRAWALLVVPDRIGIRRLVRDIPGLAELKSIAVRSGDAELREDWSASACWLARRPGKDMSPTEIVRLKRELQDFADQFAEPELRANWCEAALSDITSKEYCLDNLAAVCGLIAATKPSARNNWNLLLDWPKAAMHAYEALFDRDRAAAMALRADVKALADMVATEPMFYDDLGSRHPEEQLYRSWNDMTLHAIRALRRSDASTALALFEEMKSNKITKWGINSSGECVVEAGKILGRAQTAPRPAPRRQTASPRRAPGQHDKESIRAAVHDAMCRADGNPIYLREGFTDEASRLYTPQEFAEMTVEQSRNLKWRVSGCERWLSQSYINLLVGGWCTRGELPAWAARMTPSPFEAEVIAELRKLAIKEFTTLSAAAGEPLFEPSGRLIEARTASEIARAAIDQAKSLTWRIPGYEKWMGYDYLQYLVEHCLDPDQPEQHAVEQELEKVLPDFRRRHGHIY